MGKWFGFIPRLSTVTALNYRIRSNSTPHLSSKAFRLEPKIPFKVRDGTTDISLFLVDFSLTNFSKVFSSQICYSALLSRCVLCWQNFFSGDYFSKLDRWNAFLQFLINERNNHGLCAVLVFWICFYVVRLCFEILIACYTLDDGSVYTFRGGHSLLHTLIRAHFSPAYTGQRYIYTGCARGNCVCKLFRFFKNDFMLLTVSLSYSFFVVVNFLATLDMFVCFF